MMKRSRRPPPPKPEREEVIEEEEDDEEDDDEEEEETSSDEADRPNDDDEEGKSESGEEEDDVEESSESDPDSEPDDDDDDDCLPAAYEEDPVSQAQRVPDGERITGAVMTPVEWVRIVGTRAQQLAAGAKLMVRLAQPVEDPVAQAVLELEAKMTPLKLKRPLPDGRYEIWRIAELEIPPTSEMM